MEGSVVLSILLLNTRRALAKGHEEWELEGEVSAVSPALFGKLKNVSFEIQF